MSVYLLQRIVRYRHSPTTAVFENEEKAEEVKEMLENVDGRVEVEEGDKYPDELNGLQFRPEDYMIKEVPYIR